MLLSAVSVLVVVQSSSEIPEELTNNPVHTQFINVTADRLLQPRGPRVGDSRCKCLVQKNGCGLSDAAEGSRVLGSISIRVHVNPILPVEVWRNADPPQTPLVLALNAGSLYFISLERLPIL